MRVPMFEQPAPSHSPPPSVQASSETDRSGALSPPAVDADDGFEWLHGEMLRTLLVAVGVVTWLAIGSYVARPDAFWTGWGLLLPLFFLIVVCYLIQDRYDRLASRLFVVGLVATASLQVINSPPGSATLFLYVPVILIAGALHRARSAMAIAVLASIVAVAAARAPSSTLDTVALLIFLGTVWLTALILWLTNRQLYTTLAWLWESQREAAVNLGQARQHRGELLAALRQLEDATYRLERLNHALNWARLEAEEARRLKDQFAAQVSHELRTPINLVVGFGDMMLNVPEAYDGVPLPAQYQADLQSLYHNAKHLQGLIDDILDLAQLDAREMPLLREHVSVSALLADVVSTVRPLVDRKQLTLVVDVAPDVDIAYLDPLRMRQVLLNLVSNASRHTSEGGITIRAWAVDEAIAIAVSDTGEGIPPHQIPYVFEPFHRLNTASPFTMHEGWGLGLAICKKFVELHGGTIEAQSEGVPGRGTTFTITLPRRMHLPEPSPPASHVVASRIRRTTTSSPPPTLVVLSADPHVVSLYRRYVHGYHVRGAATEQEALDLVRTTGAHAVVVNVASFPTHGPADWHAMARRLGTRLLCCSMPNGDQIARDLGLTAFLVKPVDREDVLAAIRRAAPDPRTIAIVDDDPHMVRMLSRVVRSAAKHIRVVRAYATAEAYDLIRRVRPDVVLLDLIMPDGDGIALLRDLRSDPSLANLPVIILTAKDVAEVLPAPSGSTLCLFTSQGLTNAQTLRGIQGLLDLLPPAETAGPDIGRGPAAAPVG